jgi:hypothetical protein
VIENLRGRSTETKYGRIPLWLYETGVPLQAIAAYGWLHGRYGHYERVMPSYKTLAKELGVSKGSAVAYVKALMSVGALRVETSGAAAQKPNEYVIAFNEPFEVVEQQATAGQHADPVSQLVRRGQRADRRGQPVGHEEDVLKKTEDSLSSPSPSAPPAPPAASSERETIATPHNSSEAHQALAAYEEALGGTALPAVRRQLLADATELLTARPAWWVIDRARELPRYGSSLSKHAAMSRAPLARPQHAGTVAAAPGDGLPPWCGHCADEEPAARHNTRLRTINGAPCPACHPDALAAA